MSDEIVLGEVAFDETVGEYRFTATYLEEPNKGEALIQIWKGDDKVREFRFPSYKIWNIMAHHTDIIEGLEKDSDEGLKVAGSTGLGGNLYPE